MGLPQVGSQVIMCPSGAQGYGLAFAGSAAKSGASILTTTQKLVAFHANTFLGSGDSATTKKPVLIQMRAKSGTLTLALGDSGAAEIHADSVWTDPIPCTNLWENKESWYVTGSGSLVLEYRIYTVG